MPCAKRSSRFDGLGAPVADVWYDDTERTDEIVHTERTLRLSVAVRQLVASRAGFSHPLFASESSTAAHVMLWEPSFSHSLPTRTLPILISVGWGRQPVPVRAPPRRPAQRRAAPHSVVVFSAVQMTYRHGNPEPASLKHPHPHKQLVYGIGSTSLEGYRLFSSTGMAA